MGPRPAAILLLALLAVVGVPAPGAASADDGALLVVTDPGDSNAADDRLSLREAILLSEGELGREPSLAEKVFIVGTPGKNRGDRIRIEVAKIALDSQLPTVQDDETFLFSTLDPKAIVDGRGKVHTGLEVSAPRFKLENLAFENFKFSGVDITSTEGGERSFSLRNVRVARTRRGLTVTAFGEGEIEWLLEDSDFTEIGVKAVRLHGRLGGTYQFKDNRFLNLNVRAAVTLRLGGGAGDIQVTYEANRHSTVDGIGAILEEQSHEGRIEWRVQNNQWLGGKTGLVTQFRVEGRKNFSTNRYQLHAEAGCDLRTMPAKDVTLELRLEGELIKENGTGCRYSLEGSAELTTRLLDVIENGTGVDGFVRARARGFWDDQGSRYQANLDVGVRVAALGIVSFELFYRQDLLEGNGSGFDFRGFPDSVFIEESVISGNLGDGVRLWDTRAEITGSEICGNAGDGIHVGHRSDVFAVLNVLGENAAFDVYNRSRETVFAQCNDWGPITTSEMGAQPFPSDISVIWDVFDHGSRGLVDYGNWLVPAAGCDGATEPPGDGGVGDDTDPGPVPIPIPVECDIFVEPPVALVE